MAEIIHNVDDRRRSWIGSWEAAPLDYDSLTEADIGRTVIYRDHHRAEAGTLTSWRGGIVWAKYSRGDTASGSAHSNLVFGVKPLNGPDLPTPARFRRCSRSGSHKSS